jgi:hypothetical protein
MNRHRTPTKASARSPFAGCAILVAALLVMVFLIVFSTVTLFRQFNEIGKFTAVKPVPVEVSSLEDQDAALNGLAVRLESFRQQLAGDEKAALALSPDDINLAIAAYEAFRDFRGTLRIVGVAGDTLRIAIAFPLNGKPRLARRGEAGWLTSDPRYLNGMLVARPVLRKGEVVLKIETLEVTGAQVPQEFVEQMSPYQICERYLTDPVLGPAMAKLTRVGIADGMLVFTRAPGEAPAETIGRKQLDSASRRFFLLMGIVACVFLGIAGICRRSARSAGLKPNR